ncbi:HAD family hydrolase [Marinobacteraceae bacterium S3BR75-40.1]
MSAQLPRALYQLQAVFFDLDGTLVDSHLDFAAIREELGFPQGIGLIEHMATLPEGEVAAAWSVIDRHEHAGAMAATWMPGARELLAALQASPLATGILTRNSRKAVEVMADKLGMTVPHVLCRDDCAAKPDPQGLLRLAEITGCDPKRCLYVGDFAYDLQAARNAGMIATLYRTARNARFEPEADCCIDHFDQLQPLIP